MIDLSIVVVSYHSGPDLRTLLESAGPAAGEAEWHLTVVNNAADEDLREFLPVDDHVSIVDAGANLGYSGGLNVGLEHAPEARYVVFLNPDLILRPGSLAALGQALAAGASAAVPLILDGNGRRQPSLRTEPTVLAAAGDALFGDAWPARPRWLGETVRHPAAYEAPRDVAWATGAALAVRTDIARKVGPWDADRFFLYSEETDYARRIRDGGGTIRFVPQAVVQHRGAGSGSSPQLDALLEVNKLRYYRKWHGPAGSALFGAVLLLRNAIRPHRAGARAAVRALLSPAARAALPGGPR